MKLNLSFYLQDTKKIAKELLGKFLLSNIDNQICGGMIVEVEAYLGIKDKASHAYNMRYTERTKPMYEKGGVAYIYTCYGMHNLFNVVTNNENIPDAILIRAIEPTYNLDIIKKRTKSTSLTSGPALLCKGLKITKKHNKIKLNSSTIWIEDKNIKIKEKDIIKSKRVGIDYAKEHKDLKLRFSIKNNRWVSKAKLR